MATPFNERSAAFSPDGRWIAYESDESGTRQVYVQGFPISTRRYTISGGRVAGHRRWRSDGKELFYDSGGPVMAVDVSAAAGELRVGESRELFNALSDLQRHNYDIQADAVVFSCRRTERLPPARRLCPSSPY